MQVMEKEISGHTQRKGRESVLDQQVVLHPRPSLCIACAAETLPVSP